MRINVIVNQVRGMCKKVDLQQLRDQLANPKSFDRNIQKIKFLSIGDGRCSAEFTVEEEHTNVVQSLHGGFSATLVDLISSYALATHPKSDGPSVSVDLHCTYLKPAMIGDEVIMNADTVQVGKTLAFLTCDLRNKKTGQLLVSGTHTKFLLKN